MKNYFESYSHCLLILITYFDDLVALIKTTSRASISSLNLLDNALCSSVMLEKWSFKSDKDWLIPFVCLVTRSLCINNSAENNSKMYFTWTEIKKKSSPLMNNFNSIVNIKDLITKVITARKRSLGQGNVFTHVCHSVQGGSLYDVSSCLDVWCHVPSGVGGSLSLVPCSFGGGSLSGRLLDRDLPPLPRTIKSERYASYWNAFLFEVETTQLLFSWPYKFFQNHLETVI